MAEVNRLVTVFNEMGKGLSCPLRLQNKFNQLIENELGTKECKRCPPEA